MFRSRCIRVKIDFHHNKVDYIIMQSNRLSKKRNHNFLMVTLKFSKFLQSIAKMFHVSTKFYFLNFWNIAADSAAPPTDKAMILLKNGMISLEYLAIIYQERFQTWIFYHAFWLAFNQSMICEPFEICQRSLLQGRRKCFNRWCSVGDKS